MRRSLLDIPWSLWLPTEDLSTKSAVDIQQKVPIGPSGFPKQQQNLSRLEGGRRMLRRYKKEYQ